VVLLELGTVADGGAPRCRIPARPVTLSCDPATSALSNGVRAIYYLAKFLQGLGLFLTLDGLYLGIRYDDMQTELLLLTLGIATFYAGWRLEKRLS
jgi:hypothetical protein